MNRDTLLELVKGTLEGALAERQKALPASFGLDTEIFGKGALLDSLGLVTMVMDLENRLSDEHGVTVVLASDKAMSRRTSPFRTVGTLVEYIEGQIAAGPDA